jgi:hypothetical protein
MNTPSSAPQIEVKYSSNEELNIFIKNLIEKIQKGEIPDGAVKMKKNSPTKLLKADPSNAHKRYQPGGRLITYTGMNKDGDLIKETYGGGVADIKDNSVILQNQEPRRYPKDYMDPSLVGQPIKGEFNDDGTFVVDQNGETVLYNEYVSDTEFVKGAYGVDLNTEDIAWHTAIKLDPSFVIKNPGITGAEIVGKNGVKNELFPDSYIVIDAKVKNEAITVQSVHPITEKDLADTYVPF